MSRRLQRLLDELVEAGAHNPVVRIESARGEIIFEGARGEATPGGEPMTAATPFHTASVTKTFTATLALQLAEEGRFGALGIDAPVVALSPPDAVPLRRMCGQADPEITVRHILAHTSGLLDVFNDGSEPLGAALRAGGLGRRAWTPWDPAKAEDPTAGVINWYIAKGLGGQLAGAPGERFHYSDTGYMLLGLVIETSLGQPLHRCIRSRILEPLGLHATWFAYREVPPRPGQIEADVWRDGQPLLSDGFDLSFDWGGGGLVANAADLIAFLRALLEGRLFRAPETLAAMTAWSQPSGLAAHASVGLGLDRLCDGELQLVGRSGFWGARMVHDPDSGLFLAGSLNQTGCDPLWPAAFFRAARQEHGAAV